MAAGLQETRSLRSINARSDRYLMLGSAARGDNGGAPTGGCELWLNVKLGLRDEDLYVMTALPELLVVRALFERKAIIFAVGHAPTSDRPPYAHPELVGGHHRCSQRRGAPGGHDCRVL